MLFIPVVREALLRWDAGTVKKSLGKGSLCVKAHKNQYGQSQHFLGFNCRWFESMLRAVCCYLAVNLSKVSTEG